MPHGAFVRLAAYGPRSQSPTTWRVAFSCGLSATAVSGPGGRLPTVRQVRQKCCAAQRRFFENVRPTLRARGGDGGSRGDV
eukprot:4310643-Prymnesium_polylepis.1